MSNYSQLIEKFYTAFQNKDYKAMQDCYHPQAIFSDAAFKDLSADEVRAMWQMLITSGSDLKLEFSNIKVGGDKGTCHWEAWYTFFQIRPKSS